MEGTGLTPTHHVFAALIRVCGRAGDIPRAQRVFDMMRDAQVVPNTTLYNLFFDICAVNRDIDRLEQAAHEMHRAGVPPDEATISTCLKVNRQTRRRY